MNNYLKFFKKKWFIILSLLILTSQLLPISDIGASIKTQADFIQYLKDSGIPTSSKKGKSVNFETYQTYGMIVYGNPFSISPKTRTNKDVLCVPGRYEDQYLGFDASDGNITNKCYPDDATSGTHPKTWKFIDLYSSDGATQSWDKIDNDQASQIKTSGWIGNGATASDPLYYSVLGSENKVKVETGPTWCTRGSVFTRNRGKTGNVYYATFDVPSMSNAEGVSCSGVGSSILSGDMQTDNDTYHIASEDTKATVNYTVNSSLSLSGNMKPSQITELKASYQNTSSSYPSDKTNSTTTSSLVKKALKNSFDLTRSKYPSSGSPYTIKLEGNVGFKTKYGDSGTQKVYKTIKLIVDKSNIPTLSAQGNADPSLKQFKSGETLADVPVNVNVSANLTGLSDKTKITKYDISAKLKEDSSYTTKTLTGTAAQTFSASNTFKFTIPKSKFTSSQYTQNFDVQVKAYYTQDGTTKTLTDSGTTKTSIYPPNVPTPIPDPDPTPVDPGPVNLPPTVKITAPSTVKMGDDVFITSNPADPDGTIVSQAWNTPDANGFIDGMSGSVYYMSEGTKYVSTIVTDDGGATASDMAQIQVLPPTPVAAFQVNGTLKENRKVTFTNASISPTHFPVDPSKSYWTIKANDPQNSDKIFYKGSLDSPLQDNVDALFKKAGDYTVTLHVENTAGYSDDATKVITIEKDQPPVADFSTPTTIYRDPKNNNQATIELTDSSYSNDDVIAQRIWTIRYDSNNDGSFDDEVDTVIDDGNQSVIDYPVSKVGKYKIELKVKEEFGQPTIDDFVTDADRLTADTSSKALVDKVVEVKNLAPVVSFDVGQRKKANLTIEIGNTSYNDLNSLTSKINSIVLPKFSQQQIDLSFTVKQRGNPSSTNSNDNTNQFKAEIDDTSLSSNVQNQLINDSTNNNVNIIGLGKTANQNDFQSIFDTVHKGTFIDNTDIDSAFSQMADYIIQSLTKTKIDVDLQVGDSSYSKATLTSKFNSSVLPKLNDAGINVNSLKISNVSLSSNDTAQWTKTFPYNRSSFIESHFSPDGNTLYYNTDDKNQGYYPRITAVDFSTGISKVLPFDHAANFVVTNNGIIYYNDGWNTSTQGLHKYDPSTNQTTQLTFEGPYGAFINSMYINTQGTKIYLSMGNHLRIFDTTTNQLSDTGTNSYGWSFSGITSDGRTLLYTNYNDNGVYTLDTTTYKSTKITSSNTPMIAKMDETGKNIIATDKNTLFLYSNGMTSTITSLSGSGSDSISDIDISSDGNDIVWSERNGIYRNVKKYNINNHIITTLYSSNNIFTLDKVSVNSDGSKFAWFAAETWDNTNNQWSGHLSVKNYKTINYNLSLSSKQHFAALFENKSMTTTGMNLITKNLLANNVDLIGVGNNTNQSQINTLISTNNNVGTFLDDSDIDAAMNQLGDYIVKQVDAKRDPKVIYLTTDDVANYYTYMNDAENDPKYTLNGNTGENWRYVHDPTVFENNNGLAPFNNKNLTTPITTFDRVGKYDVSFSARDNPVGTDERFDNYRMWSKDTSGYTIYVHRKPVANFDFTLNGSTGDYTITNKGYDLDKYSVDIGNGPGLQGVSYQWRITGDDTWQDGLPPSPLERKSYDIKQTVLDFQGATTTVVKTIDATGINQPPVADFTIPNVVTEGTTVSPNDLSYDPNGDPLTYEWWVKAKGADDSLYSLFSTNKAPSRLMPLAGDYTFRLRVKDDKGLYSNFATKDITVVPSNHPPVAGFTYQSPVWIKDSINITSTASDPDNDPLTYDYSVTKPDGTNFEIKTGDSQIDSNGNLTIPTSSKSDIGNWLVKQTVSDGKSTDSTSIVTIQVLDQQVTGVVTHTEKWDQNRQKYNLEKTGEINSPRTPDVFWPGEKFVLIGNPSNALTTSIDVKIKEYPNYNTTLQLVNGNWTGSIWDENMLSQFSQEAANKKRNGQDFILTFEFTATFKSGWVSDPYDVKVKIVDDPFWREHTTY